MELIIRCGEYVAPEIDEMEIKSRAVLCQSDFVSQNEDYDEVRYDW